MKALKEIGLRKAIKFAYCTILLILFKWLLFPQLRAVFLRLVGSKVGKNVIIHDITFFNCYRVGFRGLEIGNDCFIGDDSLIDLAGQVILADQVTLAERVTMLTHTNIGYEDHPLQKYYPSFTKSIVIKEGSFIGVNATIMPGVTIGPCSVIAAGSVVTESIEPYTVVGGVPAKVIKVLPKPENISVKTD